MIPVVEYMGELRPGKDDCKDYKMLYVAAERTFMANDIPLFDLKQSSLVTSKLLINLHGYGLAEIQKAYMTSNLRTL